MRVIRRARRLAAGPTWTHEADKAAAQAGESPATVKKNEKMSNGGGSDFDCNVCLELAKEPVVTGCGHLFCWPCLYRWLYVHCDRRGRECPVCKGKVSEESNVVPIYGRGSSNGEDDVGRGLSVPPRPRGNRVESLRREFGVFRGIPRVARSPRPARTIQSEPPHEDGRAWQQQNRRLRSDPATIARLPRPRLPASWL